MEEAASHPPVARAPSRRARWIGRLAVLLALVALGALAWYLTHRPAETPRAASGPGGGSGGGGRPGAVSTVGVATAVRADLPVTIEALGTVIPSATAIVRPQVSGVLTQLLFKEGQTVRAGQALAQIDPRPFEIAVSQAEGQRLRDEAQLENARLTLKRFQTLLGQDSIARQEVDTQAATVRQLEGTVRSDRAAEATARLNLSYARITAPISGRVGLRVVDVGNMVSSGDAGGIAVITQLAPIDVEFAVPQDRVPDFERRQAEGAVLPVLVLDRTRAQVLDRGQFLTLDNQIDTTTGTVRAKARVANTGSALFPNQFVNVQVELDSVKDAIVVPVSALRRGTSGDYVYVLKDDGTVAQREVRRGRSSVDRTQIVAGLAAGERVVTEGGDRLKDGARAQVAAPAASAASAVGGARGASRSGRRASGAQPVAEAASAGALGPVPASAASSPR